MSTSSLPYIQNEMNFYGYPILLTVGDIGNIFILILFNRQRSNACSIYLMNSAVANILYLTIGGFFKIFSYSYTDQTLRSIILCKLSNYTPSFLGQVTKTLLIFACIDRYMITSRSATLRAFSTAKRAKYFTFGIYIFWAIVASHTLVWVTVIRGQCNLSDGYVKFFAFYAVIFIGLIPTVSISVFGYLTYRNMRQLHSRIQPNDQNTNDDTNNKTLKRRDRDLLVLVLSEVIVYIFTTLPLTSVHFERMVTQFALPVKSLAFIQAEAFALNVAFLLVFIFSAIPFYTYIVASSSFRQDFKQLIVTGYKIIRKLPTDPTTTISSLQRNTRVS